MTDREWIEILATHADQLNIGTDEETKYLAELSERQDRLRSLLALARKIKDTLTPVEPDPAFCENLRRNLLATACQRLVSRLGRSAERPRGLRAKLLGQANPQTEDSESQRPAPFFRRYKKEILIGAAALGSIVSVAGIVAYWIYARTARA